MAMRYSPNGGAGSRIVIDRVRKTGSPAHPPSPKKGCSPCDVKAPRSQRKTKARLAGSQRPISNNLEGPYPTRQIEIRQYRK